MTKEEKETLDEALQYAHLPELPQIQDENDGRVWIMALAKVLKINGRENYAIVKADYYGKPKIVKDFGATACIVKILEIYPYYFLKPQFCRDFNSKKEIVGFISERTKYKEEELMKMKNSEIKLILNQTFIREQLFAEKQ